MIEIRRIRDIAFRCWHCRVSFGLEILQILGIFAIFMSSTYLAALYGNYRQLQHGIDICTEEPTTRDFEIYEIPKPEALLDIVNIHEELENGTEIKEKVLYRLPEECVPLYYELNITEANLALGYYLQTVRIVINITKTVPQIILHCHHTLSIKKVLVGYVENWPDTYSKYQQYIQNGDYIFDDKKGSTIEVEPTFDKINNLMILKYEQPELKFDEGNIVKLSIEFLNRRFDYSSKGFYGMVDHNRAISVTNFMPIHAREAFPCFDEPNMRAHFKIIINVEDLKHQGNYIIATNFPIKNRNILGLVSRADFHRGTLAIAPYQVHMMILNCTGCRYQREIRISDNGLINPFTICGNDPRQEVYPKLFDIIGMYWSELASRYPNKYNNITELGFFGVPDLGYDEWNHWGSVIIRDSILFHKGDESPNHEQEKELTIANKLALYMFNYFVNIKWWNDMWLTQGISKFVAYSLVDTLRIWKMKEQFTIDVVHSALAADDMDDIPPVLLKENEVQTETELFERFNMNIYNKAAAVLKMVEDYMTAEGMQAALTRYIAKFEESRFGSSEALISLLEDEAQMRGVSSVKEILNTFLTQKGYPLVDVWTVANESNSETTVMRLSQTKFSIYHFDEEERYKSPYNNRWTIPIKYSFNDNHSEVVIFPYNETYIDIRIPANETIVLFNKAQIGYYRIENYTRTNLVHIKNHYGLSSGAMVHWIEETFTLAKAHRLSYHIALLMMTLLQDTFQPGPVVTLYNAIKDLQILLGESEEKLFVNEILLDLLHNRTIYGQIDYLKIKEKNHVRRLFESSLVSLACLLGDLHCLTETKLVFNRWIVNESSIYEYSDIRDVIFKYGMNDISDADWNTTYIFFMEELNFDEKLILLEGLSNVYSHSLLTKLVRYANYLGEDVKLVHEGSKILKAIAKNPYGISIVWDNLREHWKKISRDWLDIFYDIFPMLISNYPDTAAEEINAFFAQFGNKQLINKTLRKVNKLLIFKKKWNLTKKTEIRHWIINKRDHYRVINNLEFA